MLIALFSLLIQAQISDKLIIEKQKINIEEINGYDKISWKSDFSTNEVSSPELPVYRVSYVLPIDVAVTGIIFTVKTKQTHEQKFNIIPVQQPQTSYNLNSQTFTEPNKSVYQSDAPYPNKLYEIESDYFYMGYHLITLRIYPFEYLPLTETLNYYSQLEFTINYTSKFNNNEIYPQTQTLYRAEQCKNLVRSLVNNPNDVERFGSNVQTIRDGKNIIQNYKIISQSPQKIKSLSVLEEQVPNYIIITNNALKPVFQTLADWKTKKGIYTLIKTTDEIASYYQGNDIQEKIRNFIIESWGRWGNGLFVLLGGGNSIVPARMVSGDVLDKTTFGNEKTLYPADMYFNTYKNNWNSNLNNKFKEHIVTYKDNDLEHNIPKDSIVDNVDYTLSGIFLGRIPVDNTSEAEIMVDKIIKYEKANINNNLSYVKNHLYADYNGDIVKTYYTNTSSNIVKKVMVRNASGNDIEFNHDNFKNALDNGCELGKFHFIYHMDHGSSQNLATASNKNEAILKQEMGTLTNGDAYQILMTGSCHPANFTENCVAQYYLNNQNNGGVAFIGDTDYGTFGDDNQLIPFLSSIYNIGPYAANRHDIGAAFQKIITNSQYNYTKWHLHLLGDPEMQVWTDVPSTSLTVTFDQNAVPVGQNTVNVTVSGLASGTKARICFWKGSEVYITQEMAANGTYPISFNAATQGEIKVTATAHNYKPVEKTIPVNSNSNPVLSVFTVDFNDGITQGIGNGNGQNDAGETINLSLEVKNTGVNTANGVTATLSCNSPYINITSPQGSFGNIASGSTSASNQFYYVIRNDAPGKNADGTSKSECLANDKNPVTFTVTMKDATNTTWTKNFNIDVLKDSLIQCSKTIVSTTNGDLIPQAGETVTMNIALENIGKAPTNGITATLTNTNANCSIISGNSTYSPITLYETKNGNSTYSFTTTTNDPNQMSFNLQVSNAYGKTWNFPFNLSQPSPVLEASIRFTASQYEINLTWTAVTGVAGYNIYRCDVDTVTKTPLYNYVKLNNTPIQFAYYNDKGLQKLTRYYYKIVTVSDTGNESVPAYKMAWTSYPQINLFPVQMDGNVSCLDSPINTADVDYDGKKEIFVGASNNAESRIIALDYYGRELNNIDNNVTTYDGFVKTLKRCTATPCIADIYRDGKMHIIEPTRSGSSDILYSFSFEGEKKNDMDWSFNPLGASYRGAVVANIDNSPDGSKEIITTSENGQIKIFSNTGVLLQTLTTSGTYGAITVADLDNDGKKEIIKASGQGIYIWNADGSNYKGISTQPFYTKPADGYSFRSSVVVCDIDGNNVKDILTSALKSNGTVGEGKIYALRTDIPNTEVTNWSKPTIPYDNAWHSQEVTVGDLDGDLNNGGHLEVVAMSKNLVRIWDNTGVKIKDIPLSDNDEVGKITPILADVDNNHNDVEIIIAKGSSGTYAYKMDGSLVMGFPLSAGGGYNTTVCVSDIDNDNQNEIIGTGSCGSISVWKTDGIPSKIEWGSDRHDQYNTGEYYPICEPTLITSSATWNNNQSICNDLIIKSGTLTINNNSNISMTSSSMVIVMSGGSLIVDSGKILNCNVKVMSGGTLTLKNNGTLDIRTNGEFTVNQGAIFENQYGSVE